MTKATKTKHGVTWLTALSLTTGVVALEAQAASVPAPTVTAKPIIVKVEVTQKAAPKKITKTVTKSQNVDAVSSGSK